MNKGISTIIATIILLIITIALAGTAYMFISGVLTSRMTKVLSLLDADCMDTGIMFILRNDGTETISSNDATILVNNNDVTSYYPDLFPLPAGESKAAMNNSVMGGLSGSVRILIAAPSNSVSATIRC